MTQALKEAKKAFDEGEVPVGAVITMKEKIIARGHNQVERLNDPTAHAEIIAIRDACKTIGSFQLDDCEIYTSCEPCPMCLGAIYWARPRVVYYANNRDDAAVIGFDDAMIYKEIGVDPGQRKIPIINLCRPDALKVFEHWSNKLNKTLY